MNEKLLAYAAQATMESADRLATAIAPDVPSIGGADYLDNELLALWPDLSPDARLLAAILAFELCREENVSLDRW
jgi:hypothetical protein